MQGLAKNDYRCVGAMSNTENPETLCIKVAVWGGISRFLTKLALGEPRISSALFPAVDCNGSRHCSGTTTFNY